MPRTSHVDSTLIAEMRVAEGAVEISSEFRAPCDRSTPHEVLKRGTVATRDIIVESPKRVVKVLDTFWLVEFS